MWLWSEDSCIGLSSQLVGTERNWMLHILLVMSIPTHFANRWSVEPAHLLATLITAYDSVKLVQVPICYQQGRQAMGSSIVENATSTSYYCYSSFPNMSGHIDATPSGCWKNIDCERSWTSQMLREGPRFPQEANLTVYKKLCEETDTVNAPSRMVYLGDLTEFSNQF